MKAIPHALFHRDRHGATLTIEINSGRSLGWFRSTANGVVTVTGECHEAIRFHVGPRPFWTYESGILKEPVWNLPQGGSLGFSHPEPQSYIQLLRIAVATITNGGLMIRHWGKPRLGFHSKYHQAKRARAKAANAAA